MSSLFYPSPAPTPPSQQTQQPQQQQQQTQPQVQQLQQEPPKHTAITSDSVRVIAESMGVGLNEEVASALASDVEYRMRELIQEAAKFMRRSKRDVLTTTDVNSALRLKNVETLYGYSFTPPMRFQRVTGAKDLFCVQDPEVDLVSLIEQPLPECPRDVAVSLHWLAVEGVQPAIPQNPPAPESQAPPAKRPRMEDVEVKPVVQHVLSKELQLYFNAITQAVKESDETIVSAALNSLKSDRGTAQLLPYFTRFVADEVTNNLRNLPVLTNLMRMVEALLISSHLHTELYLHQFMPAILTCIVGKKLCESPHENHWGLRDYASSLVALVCRRYGNTYPTIQPRMAKALLRAFLDRGKPLPTHYGAVVGISALGSSAVQLLLIPHIADYTRALESDLNNPDAIISQEAKKVKEALINAAGLYLRGAVPPMSTVRNIEQLDPALSGNYETLVELFGESIQTFLAPKETSFSSLLPSLKPTPTTPSIAKKPITKNP
ncbi:transcription initiation factor TFIID complex 60 kDa subunit [Pelomyxa schiedti]|nr:transcription initiation factor TFIID complex 60 kDa subunit [Pelomyxa schiedti]